MKHYHRSTLGVVLAIFLACGLLAPGVSASNVFERFYDKEEIVNREAVSKLTVMGVIQGTDAGYFNPTGPVTRAEMAKMISTVMNPNQDIGVQFSKKEAGLTDVQGHWAAGYINYCCRLGIIAGRGDGRFDPDASVTGTEAAKMLLVAAGYDPDRKKFTGQDWEVYVSDMADALGLYSGFTKSTSDPLNRDDAALLIYNALMG